MSNPNGGGATAPGPTGAANALLAAAAQQQHQQQQEQHHVRQKNNPHRGFVYCVQLSRHVVFRMHFLREQILLKPLALAYPLPSDVPSRPNTTYYI